MDTAATVSSDRVVGCFSLEVTRGPHAGVTHNFCRRHLDDAATAAGDGSAAQPLVRVLTIGRKKKCWLRLNEDLEVSTLHAELRFMAPDADSAVQLMLRDVKSTNGSKVNGQPLAACMDWPLVDGDLVGVGRTSMRFRQVAHGRLCEDNAAAAKLPASASSTAIPPLQAVTESSVAHVVSSAVPTTTSSAPAAKANAAEPCANAPSAVSPRETAKEVSCMVCGCGLELLDLLEQQLHINACLGRAAGAEASAVSSTVAAPTPAPAPAPTAPGAKPSRKRKRPKSSDTKSKSTKAAAKAKASMNTEEQVDTQFVLVTQKISQLDAQMAKLAKKRAALVKTLDRLEKAKDKLRKTQVLPPDQVRGLLNLSAALRVIFPVARQTPEEDKPVSRTDRTVPAVAQRYVPSRYASAEEGLEEVAAISMWTRASQQLFGLQCETLLYRNSILRLYSPDSNEDNAEITGGSAGKQDLETESEAEAKSEGDERESAVPEVVKRVFPGWRRDLAFLENQTPEELEMAREALMEAQASELQEETTEEQGAREQDSAAAGGSAVSDAAIPAEDDVEQPETEDATGEGELLEDCASASASARASAVASQPASRTEQQRACEFMVEVMTRLIADKRRAVEAGEAKCEDASENTHVAEDLSGGAPVAAPQAPQPGVAAGEDAGAAASPRGTPAELETA